MGGWGAVSTGEYIGFGLTFLTVLGTLLGLWLTRRGKQEENLQQTAATRLAERDSSFDGLESLAKNRLEEINDKRIEIKDLRDQNAAIRSEWEARWSRQMERCRQITDTSSAALSRLQDKLRDQIDREDVVRVRREIEEHISNDHPTT